MREKIKNILTEAGLYKIPVDIVKLADYYDLAIYQQELDYDGAIISKKEGFYIDGNKCYKAILININQIPTRKRFTIAHELIHWITTPEEERNNLYAHRDDNLTNFNCEPQINKWASELLMPYGLVKEVLGKINCKYGISPSIIYHVADAFNVSYAAAQIRLEKFQRGV
ncbi:MAG: ImmA/IrrE family metallo-endopeptidase [Clostridia bacterium]|nr:ImmA/IrrE family metallo-endopeptidase [Clostridia bacterium]